MIVGIGELLWDLYPDGRRVIGGAPFNFAFHCRQLGHDSAILSRVGDDDLGRELRDCVRSLGVRDDWIQTDSEHPTGIVRVALDANKVPTYTIAENAAWDFIEPGSALGSADSASRLTALCFGTLALRSAKSRESILELVRMATGLRVLDINIRPPFAPSGATLERCFEAADWVKLSSDDERYLASGERRRPECRILTLGQGGCEIEDQHRSKFRVPAAAARVIDTVGAGDAFTAAMVCLHLEGRPLAECARFANYYAARVCEHRGATPLLDRDAIERAAFGEPNR